MQTLALDGRTGAAGDMILGALVAAGADPDALAPVEAALPIEYHIDETTEKGIVATTVDVSIEVSGGDTDDADANGSDPGGAAHAHQHGGTTHSHGRTHDHENDGTHDDENDETGDGHAHAHARAEGAGAHRTYAECRELVASMDLSDRVEADAIATFRRLGVAEARVHGTDLEDTHFHEVGADDAIADIVGAALLVDDLGVESVVTTPVAAGGGEVSMSHGTYPVPAPAVAYIAGEADWELTGGPAATELLTPTGAAVLAQLADGVDSLPSLSVESVGYGAGRTSLEGRPNVLRATVGAASGSLARDGIRVLETVVDDATPEVLGGLHDRLADAGARNVTVVPATMKKARPGHLIRVVVRPEDVAAVAERLAAETGTLGIRETPTTHRWIAERSVEAVTIEVGGERHEVDVKVAADDAGEVYDVSAEYDDCASVAAETDRPTREILRRAEAAYRTGEAVEEEL
ncbi:UPF0272 family protein [Natronomonas moolapensis 8.8.11]|uniref:Putative nickel insertion protein n=1 Tax=Natronomonas moolapensis (strain DSM 18674 / CECT 7526 / JCM 14361 / 8.8.11) TaxID=268739 RepID=M1XLL4_NATM8|nr:nickel pincer cofactor biosynthesis protein LarC [Natronomonas moolapensis]CCQ37928.1 UPF0272 family protein [Natronomonas moolapensis 8.8.11]